MEFNREHIKEFFEEYFEAYSTIAQDPEKNHQMSKYYAPELVVSVYLGKVEEADREYFLLRSSSHPTLLETLTPEHYIIDEASGKVAALVNGVITKKATGEVIREMWFSAHYQLKIDEEGKLKMVHLWLFSQYAPDGEKSLVELYMEDVMKAEKRI